MPISWKQQYVVAVTKGRKTRYFYGATRKEALSHAGLKKGEGFAYAKFERGPVLWGEMGPPGVIVEWGSYRKAKAA